MSSRTGSGPNSHRQRSREAPADYPPLPTAPVLPSLRTLNSPRDRDNISSNSSSNNNAAAVSQALPPSRTLNRHWSAMTSRRAERIRSLDDRLPSALGLLDDLDRSMDQAWHSSSSSSRRATRVRTAGEPRPSNFEELDRSLDEANSHLRALLDLTTQTLSPSLRPHDFPDDNRRTKRRKLDSERLATSFKSFRYGRYGQVEPGQLHMEIVSCDGGMFSNESSYAAENILKDDSSVYCTKGNRCNIVLRHQGATVFTLQELVIKAPGSMNYSHPVREGMVFISMNQDDALSRTAQYQIQYAPPPSRDHNWLITGGDSRHMHERDPRHIISIRHREDGTATTRTGRSYVYRPDDDDDDNRVPQMPEEFVANMPDFHITTECSDDEDDDGFEGARSSFRRPPNRIGALPFENPDSDSDDLANNPFGSEDPADDLLLHHSRRQNIQRHREHDRLTMSLADAWDAHASATQEAVRAVGGGELLAPHARFFIEKKKSKCTIRFDPPVSGRFILLKMWGSQHDPGSNIDIQSVISRGFAGPRYFPSVELR